jgi:uncharacterized protein (DUF488 family)
LGVTAPDETPRGEAWIWSVGHSNRSFEELAALLAEAGVRLVADIRRFPTSARHPQFRLDSLTAALSELGIRYEWLGAELGGRRRELLPAEASPNRGWRVEGFRHYADAMATEEFVRGVERLETLAREVPTAFLCAERSWWRCHRRLLSDLLASRGWQVVHLIEPGRHEPHRLTPWARNENGRLTYPGFA